MQQLLVYYSMPIRKNKPMKYSSLFFTIYLFKISAYYYKKSMLLIKLRKLISVQFIVNNGKMEIKNPGVWL